MPHPARSRALATLVTLLSLVLALLLPTTRSWAVPTASEDCVSIGLGTYHGAFTETDRSDCLTLPLPSGALLSVLEPSDREAPGAETVMVNGTEDVICDESDLYGGTCRLRGAGPFRAMITPADQDASGDYVLDFYRTDSADCPVFPAGDFTANGPAALFATGSGVFTGCFSIPPDHAATEQIQLRRHSGDLRAWFNVVGWNGRQACFAGGDLPSGSGCSMTPGVAYTVFVMSSDARAIFSLTRRDVTAGAKGCTVTAATKLGGPSKAGTLAPAGLYKCRQVTTADPKDVVHINVRDQLGTAGMFVFGSDGSGLSCNRYTACAVTGSTRYQVLISVARWDAGATTYRFDAQRIATSSGPAAECKKVKNINWGYGPLTGKLDEQHTAVCLALPTAYDAAFYVPVSDTTGSTEIAVPALYGTRGSPSCGRDGTAYDCRLNEQATSSVTPSIFLLGLPEKASRTSYRAALQCHELSTCGVEKFEVGSITPRFGIAGTKVTLSVKGNSFHKDDKVELSRVSGKRITATTTAVSEDCKTLTAVLDLKGATAGEWDLSVVSHRPLRRYLRGDFTVTASPLKNTAKPAVTGTPKVGAVLKASRGSWTPAPDAYAYQWKADGVAIAGATSARFTVPASLVGKKLTVTVRASSAKYGSRSATSDPVGPVRRS